jgi:hypothetical protein
VKDGSESASKYIPFISPHKKLLSIFWYFKQNYPCREDIFASRWNGVVFPTVRRANTNCQSACRNKVSNYRRLSFRFEKILKSIVEDEIRKRKRRKHRNITDALQDCSRILHASPNQLTYCSANKELGTSIIRVVTLSA